MHILKTLFNRVESLLHYLIKICFNEAFKDLKSEGFFKQVAFKARYVRASFSGIDVENITILTLFKLGILLSATRHSLPSM